MIVKLRIHGSSYKDVSLVTTKFRKDSRTSRFKSIGSRTPK